MKLFLTSDELCGRVRRQRGHHYDRLLAEAAPWDEDRTLFREDLCLQADSFRPKYLFTPAPLPPAVGEISDRQAIISPCGRFVYFHYILRRGDRLPSRSGRRCGHVYFTDDVIIPTLGAISAEGRRIRVLTSITPPEIFTQRAGLRLATGKVMVGGLGLGWLLSKICAKPSVTRVVLVERSARLLEWLWPHVLETYPAVVKAKAAVGDALKHVGKYGKETRYLLDVWEAFGDAAFDERFRKLKDAHPHVWGWGDCQ